MLDPADDDRFDGFFRRATGHGPHDVHRRLAHEGLPARLAFPAGPERTGTVLCWLWRRLHGPDRRATARRLIYALPPRTAPAPVAEDIARWLFGLGLADTVALHVAMGGPVTRIDWRMDMHRPAVVLGTAELLVSKALNRGLGVASESHPIEFALVTNGAHWVVHDADGCPRSAATLRGLVGFAGAGGWPTAEPLALTCLSTSDTTSDATPVGAALSRHEVLTLFDTSHESTMDELVRDADDLDAYVVWARWTPVDATGRPPADARPPEPRLRRPVPTREVAALAGQATVWRYDPAGQQWTPVTAGAPARAGETLLVAAPDGPSIDPRPQPARRTSTWVPLWQHSVDVRDQAAALLAAIDPDLPPGVRNAVVVAGFVHDAGKWHPTWQDALCAVAPEEERDHVGAGRPWAKSGIDAPLAFADDVAFRHELASLLMLDGPLRGLLTGVGDPDLVRYLVLAHHGKLRVRVPAPADDTLLGLEHGRVHVVPDLLGQPGGRWVVDLHRFTDPTWNRATDGLLARYGPYLLAYLETLVRMADWRASAGSDLPAPAVDARGR